MPAPDTPFGLIENATGDDDVGGDADEAGGDDAIGVTCPTVILDAVDV
jgi:hypothetical protein